MRCPACETDTLKPMRTEGSDLDFCSGCKGVWFDEGEAAFYLETTEDVPGLDAAFAAGRPSGRSCPRCGASLVTVRHAPESELELDACAGCRGIFLDRGELPRLEAAAALLETGGKVDRTVRALESMGYVVLGAQGVRR